TAATVEHTMRIVTVKGVDPEVVEQALKAIQGKLRDDLRNGDARGTVALRLPGLSASTPEGGFGLISRKIPSKYKKKALEDAGLLTDVHGHDGRFLLYQRPTFAPDARIFGDLVGYAPGLNTTEADIAAVLEAELPPEPGDRPGTIDPAARAL